MYRRKKPKQTFALSLDSLMDILTCVVGVMLFVVIFAVMEAKNATVTLFTPMWREPAKDKTRKMFLLKNNQIRLFDYDSGWLQLKAEWNGAKSGKPSAHIEKINAKHINDHYFNYRLQLQWQQLFIVVEPLPDITGDGVANLKQNDSNFQRLLNTWDNQKVWISFILDTTNLELFHEARKIALANGFSTGWDPVELKFPYKKCVYNCRSVGSSGPTVGTGMQ